jgi:hypothetical protein
LQKIPQITSQFSITLMNKYVNMHELFQVDEDTLKDMTKNSKTAKSVFEFLNKSMVTNLEDDIFEEKQDKSNNKRKFKK